MALAYLSLESQRRHNLHCCRLSPILWTIALGALKQQVDLETKGPE
jgi:hypothetical protein